MNSGLRSRDYVGLCLGMSVVGCWVTHQGLLVRVHDMMVGLRAWGDVVGMKVTV